ncbi:MAG TPA: hypothetical protein VF838_13730 [Trebonia sp.]
MPDSLPPIQGPSSYGDRDLDALLSCDAAYPVVVLGPVADALAALRAAPAPHELAGEAAARAAFRLFVLPEAGVAGDAPVPALQQAPAIPHQGAAASPGHPDGEGSTVVLPRTAPGGPRHARPRRRLPRPGRWQPMAVACGAAAAVIVCVVALAGAFSGSSGQQGRPGQRPSLQATDTSSKRPASSVLGTATAHPVPSTSTDSPAELCRKYMDFFTDQEAPADWSGEKAIGQQLSSLAGGWTRIVDYCAGQLGAGASRSNPDFRDRAGASDPGSQAGRGDPGASAWPRVGRARLATPQPGARSLRSRQALAAPIVR